MTPHTDTPTIATNADASGEAAPLAQRRPGRAHALAGIAGLLEWFDRNPVPTPQTMTVSHHITAADEPDAARRRATLDDVAAAHEAAVVVESANLWHLYLTLATRDGQGIEIHYVLHVDRDNVERPL
jgi:hypothetical protein